MKLIELL